MIAAELLFTGPWCSVMGVRARSQRSWPVLLRRNRWISQVAPKSWHTWPDWTETLMSLQAVLVEL